ncbi:MAG: hypothetical protein ACE5KL_05095, partial [Alphaproteobacteria bacterium]
MIHTGDGFILGPVAKTRSAPPVIARFPSRHLSASWGAAGLFARRLVALGLAAFLVLGTAKADEEWFLPETKIPALSLKSAYWTYTGWHEPRDVARARAELLLFVLKYSPDYVERNRAFAAKEDWSADFLADLDKAIEFVRGLREGDPREVYDLSKAFRVRGGDHDTSIADDLLRLAEKMGSLDARLEILQSWLFLEGGKWRKHTRWGIVFLADDGFAPAQIDLATRYRDGNGFEQSDEKAYYWLLRARANGLEVADQIEAMGESLSPEEA